jgi:hypothetical protein
MAAKGAIMNLKTIRMYIWSAGGLLLITALAKLVSAFGSAHIWSMPEPLLGLSFRTTFLIVGAAELFVSMLCFVNRNVRLQLVCITWLAVNFTLYRIGLAWIGYNKPCSCMGSLTGALRLAPETGDLIMQFVLGYLLIGGCLALYLLRQTRKACEVNPGSGIVA